jgi:ATP-dependent exoDNAse (exonuclease V) alpha subunit
LRSTSASRKNSTPLLEQAERSLLEHFRVGDKVMQTRNNYDKDVSMGILIHFSNNLSIILSAWTSKTHRSYEWSDVDELTLALCHLGSQSQARNSPRW